MVPWPCLGKLWLPAWGDLLLELYLGGGKEAMPVGLGLLSQGGLTPTSFT